MGYLIALVGDLRVDGLQNFLRFVTGSSVCICSEITVTFNHQDNIHLPVPLGTHWSCQLALQTMINLKKKCDFPYSNTPRTSGSGRRLALSAHTTENIHLAELLILG